MFDRRREIRTIVNREISAASDVKCNCFELSDGVNFLNVNCIVIRESQFV